MSIVRNMTLKNRFQMNFNSCHRYFSTIVMELYSLGTNELGKADALRLRHCHLIVVQCTSDYGMDYWLHIQHIVRTEHLLYILITFLPNIILSFFSIAVPFDQSWKKGT